MLAGFRCRSCASPRATLVLSLGRLPLANALPPAERRGQPDPVFPLDLVLCEECTLVQLAETVPPETLFRDYLYFSSVSETLLGEASGLAARVIAEKGLGPGSLVVEIASNDGYLLRNYKAAGVPVLGIEPARNVAAVARDQHGIPTLESFFDLEVAEKLTAEGHRPDVIHAHNVLAHVPDVDDFVAGLARLCAPDGVVVIEVPYLRDMMEAMAFDTIYHEHVCYFSLTALMRLFSRHDLGIRDLARIPAQGGSLRLRVARGADGPRSAAVEELLVDETRWRAADPETYRAFGRRIDALRDELVALLRARKAEGMRLAGYGANAKATILLNHFGIGADLIDFVADASPHKIGRLIPGVQVPIAAPARLLADQPDYVLLLVWNLTDEILRQQGEYRRRGGRFVRPVPTVAIL
jgi:SAM-dependent methyltransferase